MSLILPSYQSGFAPRDYEPTYPSLWQGCVAAYAPLLGPTGLVLRDAVGKNDGVLTGMSANDDWIVSGGRWALDFDGSNDWVNCGDAAACRAIESGLWTVSSWVYSRNGGIYFGVSLGSTNSTLVAFYDNSVAQVNIIGPPSGNAVLTSASFPRNQWANATWVMSNSGSKFYLNGAEQSVIAAAGTNTKKPFNANSFNIASLGAIYVNNAPTGNHNSQLGETRVYSRPLQDNEIRVLASKRGIAYEPRRVRVRYFRGFSPKKKLLEAKITSTVPGSYQTGYAPRDGEPVYPELWKGCVGAWSAGLGPSGLTLRDNSPAENHGTLVNGPTYQVSGGQYALSFDGTLDNVDLLNNAKPLIPATGDWTISSFVRLNTLGDNAIFAQFIAQPNNGRILLRCSDSPTNVFELFLGNEGAFSSTRLQTGTVETNRWYHVAVIRRGDYFAIYLDGVLGGTTTQARNILQCGNLLGSRTDNGSVYNAANLISLNGFLDDTRVYNRALSESEIKTLATRRNIAYEYKRPRTLFRAYDPIKQVGVGKITSIIPGGYHTGVGGLNNEPAYPELTKGLVGGWCPSLGVTGGVLRDNSGQGNHGVLTNMDPGTDWVVSGGKYALDFDGTDDKVTSMGQLASYSFIQNANRFSIAFWARFDTDNTRLSVMGNTLAGSEKGFFIVREYIDATWGQNSMRFISLNGSSQFVTTGTTADSTALAGVWSHWCFVCNNQNRTGQWYKDGAEVTTTQRFNPGAISQGALPTGDSTRTLNFGIANFSSDIIPLDGNLDDLRLYDRALTPNEIKLLASRRGIGYDYKTHRSYSKTQSSGLLKRLLLTGQT